MSKAASTVSQPCINDVFQQQVEVRGSRIYVHNMSPVSNTLHMFTSLEHYFSACSSCNQGATVFDTCHIYAHFILASTDEVVLFRNIVS